MEARLGPLADARGSETAVAARKRRWRLGNGGGGSETAVAGSETAVAGSGTVVAGSGTAVAGSGTVVAGSGRAVAGAIGKQSGV